MMTALEEIGMKLKLSLKTDTNAPVTLACCRLQSAYVLFTLFPVFCSRSVTGATFSPIQ